MVKLTGPVLSIAYAPLLRKKRSPFAAAVASTPLPPPVRHVNVTAGDPAPNPDVTGTYVYYEEHDGEPAYRQVLPPNYRVFHAIYKWRVNPADSYTNAAGYWRTDTYVDVDAPYTKIGTATGNIVVSAEISS